MFRARAPFSIALYAKPALLLQEIEKDDLAEQLFGKVYRVNAFGIEIGFDFGILCYNFIQRFLRTDK